MWPLGCYLDPSKSAVCRALRGSAAAAVIITCLWASSAYAFDHSRSGFVLELGIGPGLAPSSEWTYSYATSPRTEIREPTSGVALQTRIRIGAGLTRQWMLTFMSDVAWGEDAPTVPGNWGTMANELDGIALTRFLSPESPSYFFEAAAGFAGVTMVDEEDWDFDESGFGMQLGIGVEPAGHWALRLSYMYAWYDDIEDRQTAGVTFSRIWY